MDQTTIGFALTGSFCTFSAILPVMDALVQTGANVIPILSPTASMTDTRFGKAAYWHEQLFTLTQNEPITTIAQAEPIGPKKLLDILVIAPCTGNSIGKMANGITDTCVTMAAKAHLRNERPLLIGVSTNDALGASAANIGKLLNTKNVYFIPMKQDDAQNKPRSVVADFDQTLLAVKSALLGRQLQPILCGI